MQVRPPITAWVFLSIFIAFVLLGLFGHLRARSTPRHVAMSTVLVSDDGGHGSGVHIGNGYILTAAHVVENKDKMTITDSDGNAQAGTVLWANKAYDVALLAISDHSQIGASKLDCHSVYRVGKPIRAVGSPANLKFVTTWGHISASVAHNDQWERYFLADISIGPGMSGGPVFDAEGKVIGLSVGISLVPINFSSVPYGVSYIVPSSSACTLLAEGMA